MSNQPVNKIKYGGLELAVWEKESEKYGTTTSFSLNKSYQDKNEKWVNQVIYLNSATDLINVIQCCQAALEYRYRKDDTNVPVNETDEP